MARRARPWQGETESLTWPALASLGIASLGLILVGGLLGIVAAVGVGIVWYVLSAPAAVALGYLFLVALLPPEVGLLQAVTAAMGLFGVLATAGQDAIGARFGALLAGLTLVLTGVAAVSVQVGGVVTAGLTIAVVAILLGYLLHRYELLRLGLLDTTEVQEKAFPTDLANGETANSDGQSHRDASIDT